MTGSEYHRTRSECTAPAKLKSLGCSAHTPNLNGARSTLQKHLAQTFIKIMLHVGDVQLNGINMYRNVSN